VSAKSGENPLPDCAANKLAVYPSSAPPQGANCGGIVSFRRVARVADVPEGRGLCVRIDVIEVGLFRVAEEIHAMENRCPHAGDPLSEGELRGSIIVCPGHGWDFDVRTGFRPGLADGFPIPCFPVRLVDGHVEVDIARSTNIP
jgi:nitrite reductase (NADH) small subunit